MNNLAPSTMHHGRCHWSRALCQVSGRACSCKKDPCYENQIFFFEQPSKNRLFFRCYYSDRPHFLWVYRRDNPHRMLGEHRREKLVNHQPKAIDLQAFECSPNIPRGLSRRLTRRKYDPLLLTNNLKFFTSLPAQ